MIPLSDDETLHTDGIDVAIPILDHPEDIAGNSVISNAAKTNSPPKPDRKAPSSMRNAR